MKRLVLLAGFVAALTALPLRAQAPSGTDQQRLLGLIKDVQTQQVQIADYQQKIETKVTEISEAIRVARIFAGKSK